MILLIIFIIFVIIFSNYKCENFSSKVKIAIYSANFGNYRNESKDFDQIKKIKELDYYFFTDNPSKFVSKTWKIINYPLAKFTLYGNMDKYRYTAKTCKFSSHPILNQYDYVLYIDSKKSSIEIFNKNISYNNIINLILTHKDTDIFFRQHPDYPVQVKTIYDEIDRVIYWNRENSDAAIKWDNSLKKQKWKQEDPFIDSDIILKKNKNSLINTLLSSIPDLLVKNKLSRDQIVLPYFLQKNKNFMNYKIINKNFKYLDVD